MHRLVIHMQKKAVGSRLCSLFAISRLGFYATQVRLEQPAVVTQEPSALVGRI